MSAPAPAQVASVYALLISQDPATVEQLIDPLRGLATFTDVCTNVHHAFQLLNQRKFEAVVVDLGIGNEAKEIIERVRLSPSNRTTVTFAIAADSEQMQTAFDAGSNFVLTKPLSAASVGRTLHAAYGLIVRERRRYFRCQVSIPATIRTDGEIRAELQGETVNISEEGIALTTRTPLEPGTQVGVRFTIPGQTRSFIAESEVRWYDRAKARVGLHFLSLPPKHQSNLQDWLAKKLEEILPQSVIGKFQ